ncbi:hypothetical protein [Phenylobacterium sp.]|jgi:hypothetical protein|uniref:hypothetical protein n=1 Tax=Phenylobacterium sp. TaxID=1871053 RepID=UPI002E34F35E|nr:hypothetical protein [Phenylobacterium sp.]HEX4708858.1 hypothetical protein [Phenylobacterium sp.]
MAARVRLLAAAALLGLLTACEQIYGPSPPPGRMASFPTNDATFRAGDFAWSKAPGHNTLVGVMAFHNGGVRYTCAGATVVLTPETPWSRKRMMVLYRSDQRSALPAEEVRGRTAQAPPGDSNPYVKRGTCDSSDRVSFSGLPDGAWYVVTLAKPVSGQSGASLAMMRRVVTRGGRATTFDFY